VFGQQAIAFIVQLFIGKENMNKGGKPSIPVKQTGGSNLDLNSKSVFRLALFDHLPRKSLSKNITSVENDAILHPAIVKLGLLYSRGLIFADDDRVSSLVAAFCNVIQDYKTPQKKAMREDLDKNISKQVYRNFVFLKSR
jgi:translation initiation factor eIF-2B subunit delta